MGSLKRGDDQYGIQPHCRVGYLVTYSPFRTHFDSNGDVVFLRAAEVPLLSLDALASLFSMHDPSK